jgi:hypothetical protein
VKIGYNTRLSGTPCGDSTDTYIYLTHQNYTGFKIVYNTLTLTPDDDVLNFLHGYRYCLYFPEAFLLDNVGH